MLSVCDLTVTRGGVPVLSGVTFSLAAGKALVLRGPNGAGKTTLLRTIAGLQPPLGGTMTRAEDDVAYAAHADGLKSALTVAENLSFWAAIYGTSSIDAALEAYALRPLADRPAGTLSAGQKRRAGLARLVVTGRMLWLLDEPTVSLDAEAVQMFAAAMRGHLSGGGAAVLATHIDLKIDAEPFDLTDFRVTSDVRLGASDEAFL